MREIREARPLRKYKVRLVFKDGEKKVYDANSLVERHSALKNGGTFRQAVKRMSGKSISWSDSPDVPFEAMNTIISENIKESKEKLK